MNQTLKRWEIALMAGVLCALGLGVWLQREQTALADNVIRLHVLANSDQAEDQALKLAVRDQVLVQAANLYPEDATLEEAHRILQEHLELLAQTGQAVVEEQGYDYPVSVELTRCWFPTKVYGDFALPAGNYNALRVIVGEGEGQNWWCVAFPPLCLGAVSETVEEATEAGLFTEDQAGLITRENEGYVLKFKGLELLGRFQHLFG